MALKSGVDSHGQDTVKANADKEDKPARAKPPQGRMSGAQPLALALGLGGPGLLLGKN